MRSLGWLLLTTAAGLAMASWACVPEDVPGEQVGTYLFAGPLEANECGSTAFAATDPLEMRVELRQDGTMAIWRRPGAAIVFGVVEEDGSWLFESGGTTPAYEGCVFLSEETIVVEGVGDEEPVAHSTVRFSVAPGSDCTPSHASAGGPFLALPCEARWTLGAESIDPLF